uniref:Capsid protein n=1 Tax=Genomoviridae sp. TaxID=2202565 RepID=A0A8F5RBD3_9VIRU|nr:MAG: capsid protein [Genomoviridae sp.]
MALRTRYRRRSTRSRRAATRPSRRPAYRGRTRVSRRRPMISRRRILNITSRKKSDTMMAWSNVTVPRTPASSTFSGAVPTLTGDGNGFVNDPYMFLWCATARDYDLANGGTEGAIHDQATRTAQTCFIRGLKENIMIQTNNGVPWQWRRLIFSMKGIAGILEDANGFQLRAETSAGNMRAVSEIRDSNQNALVDRLFRGDRGEDWSEYINAPVDTKQVTVHYDRTRTIAAGNESGMLRQYKFWHPFNKNIVYNDVEDGGGTNDGAYSTLAKPGMGDVLVMDLFQPRSGADLTARLIFRPNATLYWHER